MKKDKTQGLIADIGATNARFALADAGGIYKEKILKCRDYPGLSEAARAYLAYAQPGRPPQTASIAIAGPVTGDRFEMTNHLWSFSAEETRKALGLEGLHLMNDFRALALAVPHLQADDVHKVTGPAPKPGAPIGVIGPGTGLGVASLVWDGRRYIPVPGEGGHVTMPAVTLREFDVFAQLRREKYTHISAERVCSGKGLVNLYSALRALDGKTNLPDRSPEEISAAALDGRCALCREALDLMLGFLGRVAGNLALTLGAQGGIYIAGGIVRQLGAHFQTSPFLNEFTAKGRFSDYVRAIPVFVIRHPFPAFIGLQADLSAE
jgi:glucokinase